MKKIIKLICVTLLFGVLGCSNPDEGYNEAYQTVLSEIGTMNTATDEVANYNMAAWEKVGPSDIAYFLNMSATAKDEGDVGGGSAWKVDYPLMDTVFGTNVEHAKGLTAQKNEIKEKVIPIFLAYQDNLSIASEKDSSISGLIKDMKEKYEKNHSDAISALSQYYLDSSSYHSYVIDVGGKSLLDYSNEIAEYKKTITESQKAAELAE